MKTYPEILRDLREDRDYTQAQIAEVLGTTQQVYSRYENGINEMPVRHLRRLCEFYQVSADYVLGLPPLPSSKAVISVVKVSFLQPVWAAFFVYQSILSVFCNF